MVKDIVVCNGKIHFIYDKNCEVVRRYISMLGGGRRDWQFDNKYIDYQMNEFNIKDVDYYDIVVKWIRKRLPKDKIDMLRLTGIEPVTFMGSTIFGHDEKYDFYLIKDTMEFIGNIEDDDVDWIRYGIKRYNRFNSRSSTDTKVKDAIVALYLFKKIKRAKKLAGFHAEFVDINIQALKFIIDNSFVECSIDSSWYYDPQE